MSRLTKEEKYAKEVGDEFVAFTNEFPKATFGKWLTKQECLNAVAQFMSQPELNEIFLDLQIRVDLSVKKS